MFLSKIKRTKKVIPMNKILVLNHKMNMLYDDVYDYINQLNNISTDMNIIICPSYIYLTDFVNHSDWGIGSQNVYHEANGAYTGEISTTQLRSIGVEYSLLGHYERTKYFHESEVDTNQKLKACLEGNIIPIVCLQAQSNDDKKTLTNKLDTILEDIDHIEFIIFAYEPTDAIGQNKTLQIDQIEETCTFISEYLQNKYHTRPNILYGGSVTNDNINDILAIDTIAGTLIGEKSSNYQYVTNLIDQIEK